ncbi:HlyD family efflux transporter periplasmic adaptor subunit, partial [Cereibacter changlensis]
LAELAALLDAAERPLIVAGGSGWDAEAVTRLAGFAEAFSCPVTVSFRRQGLFPCDHPNFAGDLSVGANPKLVDYAKASDLVLLLGGRLSEMPSQSYSLLTIPCPAQKFIHVHPGAEEIGRVYRPDLAFNMTPRAFLAGVGTLKGSRDRKGLLAEGHAIYHSWSDTPTEVPGSFNLGEVMVALRNELPRDAVVTNGAGNYAIWLHRYYRYRQFGTQLAPTSGSMGYGVPAAVAAKRVMPQKTVVAFAGDGCFLMTGQEFATAVQYDLPVIVVVVDNGMYGTIRMHQEREYPGRVIGTELKNPDFAAYARAFGGHGERVETTAEFMPAFRRAQDSGKPAILHCVTDPEALTPARSLSQIRAASQAAADTAQAAAISANARVMVAVQTLEAARAQLSLVEAQLENVELQLARTNVVAPVAGEIVQRNAQVGAIASASGTPMFSLMRDAALELRADVAEGDLLRLKAGQGVRITTVGGAAPL